MFLWIGFVSKHLWKDPEQPTGRYSNSQKWHRSSCKCLGMVFEVVQECAMRAICLTDTQLPSVPEEKLTRVRQGEEQKHKHEIDPVYHRSCTFALAPPDTAWCHLGATGWTSGATSWQLRALCFTAQPSCMSGVSQAWGQIWQDRICPAPRGCRVQVSPCPPKLIPASESQPQGQCFKWKFANGSRESRESSVNALPF